MKKMLRNIVTSLLVVTGLVGCSVEGLEDEIIEQIKNSSDVVSITYLYSNAQFLQKESAVVSYEGVMKLSLDTSKLNIEIQKEDNKEIISISNLNDVQLEKHSIDVDSVKVVSTSRLSNFKIADMHQFIENEKIEVENNLVKSTQFTEAKNLIKQNIRNIILSKPLYQSFYENGKLDIRFN